MAEINAVAVQKYAGSNIDRWKEFIGIKINHNSFGEGVISDIKNNRGDICILIEFYSPNDIGKQKRFGPQVFNFLDDIDLPAHLAHRIAKLNPRELVIPIQYDDHDTNRAVNLPIPLQTAPDPKFLPGQEVYWVNDPNQRGRIIRTRIYNAGVWNYDVYYSTNDIRIMRETDLVLWEPRLIWGNVDDLLRDLAMIKMHKPLGDALYALYGSRTKFEVYQFKPAVKFLSNPDQRLLIADEVGLGKTIEAGIIYLELQARLGIERVLVVCPSSLRQKWQDEMKSRFDEEFDIFDSAGINRYLYEYKSSGGNMRLRGIISLELIRRREIAEQLNDLKLDLVVIDEAHHCRNTTTLANAVATVLVENSDAALMLTATPLQMGKGDLYNLLNILSPGEFDNPEAFIFRLEPNQYINRAAQILSTGDTRRALVELRQVEKTQEKRRFLGSPYYKEVVHILGNSYITQQEMVTAQRRLIELNTLASVFTRTRKRDILEKPPVRTAYTLPVHFTPQEMGFYEQVVDEIRQKYYMEHRNGVGSSWITIMKERQVASCISAVLRSENRREYEVFPEDEAFESDFSLVGETDENWSETSVKTRMKEIKYRIMAGSRRSAYSTPSSQMVDSKFTVFWESLEKILNEDTNTKILVFSFFRETINYLRDELQRRGVNLRAIHGGYKVLERQQIIEDFRDNPLIRVLVSSDVGSEGLDFQFCDTLFNYDLPWNPMKVEQRIGRIDRFGQESDRIRIYNMVIEDTIESRILMRLYNRIEIFKQSIGDLEVILGEEIRELTQDVFTKRLTKAEEIRRAELSIQNILKQKQEMEEFEEKRLQFLGQEAIFSTTVEQTIESGRYVSDREIQALVSVYLSDNFPLSRLEQNDDENSTFILVANEDLIGAMNTFILKMRRNDKTAQHFLKVLRPSKEIPLTFQSELAFHRKLLEFITPRHPLAQAALEYWKDKSEYRKRLTRFQIQTEIAPPGKYYFFIYSIDTQGIDKNSRIVSVVVNTDSGDVNTSFSKQFLRLIQVSNLPENQLKGALNEYELNWAEDSAMLYITNARDEIERQITASNEALVNARLTAVEQSYDSKRKRIEGIRQKVSDISIRRMYEGQLRNMDAKYNLIVAKIEKGRQVGVSFSLILRGFVQVLEENRKNILEV